MMRIAALVLIACALPAMEPTVDAECPWTATVGWTPIIVTIDSDRPRTFDFNVSNTWPLPVSAEVRVSVPAGVSRHSLLLPGTCENSSTVRWRSDDGFNSTTSTHSRNTSDTTLVLVDPGGRINSAAAETLAGRLDRQRTSWRSGSGKAGRIDPGLLPTRWQGYPHDQVLILAPGAEKLLNPAQREALATWATAGGVLAIWEPSPWWAAQGAPVLPLVLDAEGRITNENVLIDRAQPLFSWQPNERPVPGTQDLPIGGFLTLAGLFVLIAGPLNFWWCLKRRKERRLLLLTIPALSLTTCLALLAWNLLSEGVTTRRVRDSLSWLDGRTHREICFAGATYYAPFGHRRLALGADDLLLTMNPDDWRDEGYRYSRRHRRETSNPGGLGLVDGAVPQAIGPWVPARFNRRLTWVSPRPNRDRLILRRSGGGLELVNGLPVAIERLAWRAPDGRQHACGPLAPGQATRLDEVKGLMVAPTPQDLGPQAAALWNQAQATPGCFRAKLAAPLAAPPGPAAIDAADGIHLLAGPLAIETAAAGPERAP